LAKLVHNFYRGQNLAQQLGLRLYFSKKIARVNNHPSGETLPKSGHRDLQQIKSTAINNNTYYIPM
jgi:hypothetical protein